MLIHNTAIKVANASQEINYIATNQDKNFGILKAPLKPLFSVVTHLFSKLVRTTRMCLIY